MTVEGQTPAGWYPDPHNPSQERLFDGFAWTQSVRRPRRSFAAPYENKTLAYWLIGGAVLLVFGLYTIPVSIGLIVWAIYLLRGEGENPAKAHERARRQLEAEQRFHQAVQYLAQVNTGAAGLVALRNVDAAAEAAFGADAASVAAQALAGIGVDRSTFVSQHIGNLLVLGTHAWLEVFRNWIIVGQEAHDVDQHTRASVFLDGSIQVVARQVKRGDSFVTVNEQHDMRRAEMQIVSDEWSVRVPIRPDDANEARRIADQLNAAVARMRPAAATGEDIRSMVEAILNNTGQPPAEKLKQLSNLRYDRLLSDAEFQQAKERILGIGQHFEA